MTEGISSKPERYGEPIYVNAPAGTAEFFNHILDGERVYFDKVRQMWLARAEEDGDILTPLLERPAVVLPEEGKKILTQRMLYFQHSQLSDCYRRIQELQGSIKFGVSVENAQEMGYLLGTDPFGNDFQISNLDLLFSGRHLVPRFR
jgi:hypothetical protein